MSARNENASPVVAGRGAEEVVKRGLDNAHDATHGPIIKRLIVGAALRGLLLAGFATWLINILGLRGA